MQKCSLCVARAEGRGTDKNIHSSRFKYYFDLNANWIKQKSIVNFYPSSPNWIGTRRHATCVLMPRSKHKEFCQQTISLSHLSIRHHKDNHSTRRV